MTITVTLRKRSLRRVHLELIKIVNGLLKLCFNYKHGFFTSASLSTGTLFRMTIFFTFIYYFLHLFQAIKQLNNFTMILINAILILCKTKYFYIIIFFVNIVCDCVSFINQISYLFIIKIN